MNTEKEVIAEVLKDIGREDVSVEHLQKLLPYMMLDYQAHLHREAATTPEESARWKSFSECLHQLLDGVPEERIGSEPGLCPDQTLAPGGE
jgi:hypothetical protein